MGELSSRPVRGFRDLLPPDSLRAGALEACAREVFLRYGFEEIRLPTVEHQELFVKTTGETTDIVEKEMFHFEDAGGRRLALRPEGTPGVVRAVLDRHLRQQGGVTKLFYSGSMFRAERPQKGRYREFSQIGVETLGNPHPAADVEAILALQALFNAAGLKGRTRLRLNNLGCDISDECRPRFRRRLRDFLKSREAELCDNCRRRMDRNPLRALDCKGDAPKLAQAAPKLEPCGPCREHVEQVSGFLEAAGCSHTFPDAGLVRGLDYYTRTVFEFQADGIGSQDAIAGGGRYDSLVGSMGGPQTPAVGWALGLERTLLAVEAADPEWKGLAAFIPAAGVDAFVALQTRGEGAASEGVRLLALLRDAGLRAGGGLFSSSLKAQMKEASRQDARCVLILGEDELKKDPPSCMLRDMAAGSQDEVPLEDAASAVRARLQAGIGR